MYRKKPPKVEKRDLEKISTHCGSASNLSNGFTVVSIDPGIQNFAIRIEKRLHDPFRVETLLYEKPDFRNGEKKPKLTAVLKRLHSYLEGLLDLFSICDVFLVEKQDVGHYNSTRIMQHLLSFFIIHFPESLVQEFDSKYKTGKLGSPSHLGRVETKKFTITIAQAILHERGDEDSLAILNSGKKADDYGDVIAQIEAFCVVNGLPQTMDYTKDWERVQDLNYDVLGEAVERDPDDELF